MWKVGWSAHLLRADKWLRLDPGSVVSAVTAASKTTVSEVGEKRRRAHTNLVGTRHVYRTFVDRRTPATEKVSQFRTGVATKSLDLLKHANISGALLHRNDKPKPVNNRAQPDLVL